MPLTLKYLPILGVAAIVSPAFGITVNMTDFSFASPQSVTLSDPLDGISYSGAAGRFDGTLSDPGGVVPLAQTSPDAATSVSFVAYCGELTQFFSFGVNYTDYALTSGAGGYGSAKSADLSRLYTAYASFVVDAASSAAMQAGIWEIIYERGQSYGFSSGNFVISTQDQATAAAFARVDSLLGRLSTFSASYQITVLQSGTAQDFIIGSIPEPETWALLAGGLGLVAWFGRRPRRL